MTDPRREPSTSDRRRHQNGSIGEGKARECLATHVICGIAMHTASVAESVGAVTRMDP
jgi:hypothetical protein